MLMFSEVNNKLLWQLSPGPPCKWAGRLVGWMLEAQLGIYWGLRVLGVTHFTNCHFTDYESSPLSLSRSVLIIAAMAVKMNTHLIPCFFIFTKA